MGCVARLTSIVLTSQVTCFLSGEPSKFSVQATVNVQIGIDGPRDSPSRNVSSLGRGKRSCARLTLLVTLGSVGPLDQLSGGDVFQRTRDSGCHSSGSRDGAGEGVLEEEHRGDEDEDERTCGPHVV
jgi:hypothetical protein